MGIENQGIRGNTARAELTKNTHVPTSEAFLQALKEDPESPFIKDLSEEDAFDLDIAINAVKGLMFSDLARFDGDAAVMKQKLEELSRATDDSLRKRVAKEIADLVHASL